MDKRKEVPEKVSKELWIRSAGRCQLCNKDLTTAYLSRGRFNSYAQMAHIVAYSENGPRAVEFATKDNSYENLMLLCPECHKTIDDFPKEFSIDYLKNKKRMHDENVRKALDMLSREQYVRILYSSTIFKNNERSDMDGMNAAMLEADIFCGERTVLLEDRNDESEQLVDILERNFNSRIRPTWDDGEYPKYCIFATGPMYCLMKLGSFFCNYRNDIKIAIKTRKEWILREGTECVKYQIIGPEPGTSDHDVVLELNVSAPSNTELIGRCFPGMERWQITVPEPGIDIVDGLADIRSFGRTVTETLDRISRTHPKGVVIHVVPRVCNALAVQFGMAVMPKIHSRIKVYDVKEDTAVFMCCLGKK